MKKGFTLIELLIVIAVLGILAVAVLSAINPIEQINRSKDTGSRSDAEQLIGGIDRFYSSSVAGLYPWQIPTTDPPTPAQLWVKVNNLWLDQGGAAAVSVLGKLSAVGTAELKESFTNRISSTDYNPLYIWNAGTAGASTYVCFLPKSQSFKTAALDRCTVIVATGKPADYPPIASACAGGASLIYYSCLP